MRVRLPGLSCKPAARRARLAPLVLLGALAGVAFAGCHTRTATPTTDWTALDLGSQVTPRRLHRAALGDPAGLAPLHRPLSARLGVVVVRNADDWQTLADAIPDIGPCPDLTGGAVIGLVTRTGTPVDGGWPVQVTGARQAGRAGVVQVSSRGGAYLSTGIVYVEVIYVPGPQKVVAVDLDGWRQYLH